MADYFNPETGVIRTSLHEAPSPDWIKNPAGIREAQVIPVQYRVFKNGRVQEASKIQKTAINKRRLPAIKAARKAALAEEARQRLALADPDYVAAAASVDAATSVAAVEAVRLTSVLRAT